MRWPEDVLRRTREGLGTGAGVAQYRLGQRLTRQWLETSRAGWVSVEVREAEGLTEVERGGLFGLPVWGVVELGSVRPGGVTYKLGGREKRLPRVRLEAVVMTVRGGKTVVKTEMTGAWRVGSVKELMGYRDYEVRLAGVLWDAERPDVYPQAAVEALAELCEAPVAVPVANDLLNGLGVMQVVIEEWSLPPYAGRENVQPYELSCVSDEAVELKVETRQELEGLRRTGL